MWFADRDVFNRQLPVVQATRPLPASFPDVVGAIPPIGPQDADLAQRQVIQDPREAWLFAFPYKLTPNQCLNILRQALGGDLWQQSYLLALMLDSWATFRMASHKLREAACYTRFNVLPFIEDEGEKPTESAIKKAKLVSRGLRGMSPDPFSDECGMSGMIYDFTDAMLNGIAMTELIWNDARPGPLGYEQLPRAAAWVNPMHLSFTRAGLVCLYRSGTDRLDVPPELQLEKNLPRTGKAPNPNKFICSQFKSKSGSVLGAGFMRPLALYWAARQFNWDYMLRTARQHGTPFTDITFQPGKFPDAEREKILAYARQASVDRVLVHPQGTEAKVYPAQSLGPDNPTRFVLKECDEAALFLLLGQSATTMSTPGKLGEEGTHADVEDDRVRGVCNWAARNPLRQFARAILRVNIGDNEEVPNIEPDLTKPLDSAQVSQLVMAITGSGIPVRSEEFYKKISFTPPETGDTIVKDHGLAVMEDPMTATEMAEQQMEMQAQMAAQSSEQVEAAISERVRNGNIVRAGMSKDAIGRVLASASKSEVDEVEALVLRAQKSGTGNGEWKAVRAKIVQLANKPKARFKMPESR